MANSKEEVNVSKLYGKECTLSKEEFIKTFHFSESGLKSSKATEILDRFGSNEITQAKPKKWYNYLLESLLSPFNCILIGIVFILFYIEAPLSAFLQATNRAKEVMYDNFIGIIFKTLSLFLLSFIKGIGLYSLLISSGINILITTIRHLKHIKDLFKEQN